jgi:hypothetical protein
LARTVSELVPHLDIISLQPQYLEQNLKTNGLLCDVIANIFEASDLVTDIQLPPWALFNLLSP